MANIKTLKPFRKGYDPRRHKKQKGEKSFRTLFKEATKKVAEALRLGKEPNAIELELIKRGIKEALKGNYSFYKDILDRLYGKPKEKVEMESEELPIKVVIKKENSTAKEVEEKFD